MRVLFSALMILLVVSISTKAQDADVSEARPFHISSLNTAFAVQGDFKGEYRIHSDWIEVKVTKANIRISHDCPYKGRRLLSAMKFGLATNTDGKRWNIAHAGQEFFLERVMRPGDVHSLDELYFHIPIERSTDLSRHWLVIQLEDVVLDVAKEKQLKGYAYAHSCKDIFCDQKN
jgi:hypothetical protein